MKWVIFKSLLIAYKALNGTGESYIREMLPLAKVYCEGLWSSDDPLCLEESRTNLITDVGQALSIATVKSWNDLPLDISMAKTMDTFISKLKTHFFQIVYGWTDYPCCIIVLMNISSNGIMVVHLQNQIYYYLLLHSERHYVDFLLHHLTSCSTIFWCWYTSTTHHE